MDDSYKNRIWVATAPPGVWSSGPAVIYEIPGYESVEEYERMGWEIEGPFVLVDEVVRLIRSGDIDPAFRIHPDNVADEIVKRYS